MVSSDSSKSHLSLALGGAAVAALSIAAYYKFVKQPGSFSKATFEDIHNVTSDQLAALLDELVENQEIMKNLMADLQKEIVAKDLGFFEVCEKVGLDFDTYYLVCCNAYYLIKF